MNSGHAAGAGTLRRSGGSLGCYIQRRFQCTHRIASGSWSSDQTLAQLVRPSPCSRERGGVSGSVASRRRSRWRCAARRCWSRTATLLHIPQMRSPLPVRSSRCSKSATHLFKYKSSGGVAVSTSRNRTGVARYALLTARRHWDWIVASRNRIIL